MKTEIPWWVKIVAKLFLSRLPIGYNIWQKLGLFRHGSMDISNYAISVFDNHVFKANLTDHLRGKMILELGPGDSIATAIIASTYGAQSILVDTGSFIRVDISPYMKLARELKEKGLPSVDLSDCKHIDKILLKCQSRYLTNGLISLKKIDDESVDLIFSQAVLEHVRRREFLETMKECRRILKKGGVCSHKIDLRDHLGGGLNNLRFNEMTWESDFFAKSGFYTNRIRFIEMMNLFKEAGFQAEATLVSRWETLPTPQNGMSKDFRNFPTVDLLVSGFEALLYKA